MTPLVGVAIPNLAGMISHGAHSPAGLIASYAWFIAIAFLTWEGNLRLYLRFQDRTAWLTRPWHRVRLLVGLILLFTIPFTTAALWSWAATTPSDSKIEFYVQTAATAAELATATRDPLLFTNPPGPSALAGTAVVAKAGSPDTRSGSATVQNTLAANSRNLNFPHLRISARLVPTTDKLQAPVLTSWNLQTSCQESQ